MKLPPKDEITLEDVASLIKGGIKYQEELKIKLKDIKVPVSTLHPHVLQSIREIFGPEYLDSSGRSYITFDMVVKCMKIIRNVGKAVAEENAP